MAPDHHCLSMIGHPGNRVLMVLADTTRVRYARAADRTGGGVRLTRDRRSTTLRRVTTFDELDWHVAAATERGQSAEHAFAHIGLYLAWAIRNDLHDPDAIPANLVAAVLSGEPVGPAVRAAVHGRLQSDVLSAAGAEFTAWYYPRYLDDFATAFADATPYSVVDGAASYARIAPTIERRYAEWIAASWADEPGAPTASTGGLTFSADDLLAMSPADLEAIAQELADAIAGPGTYRAADGPGARLDDKTAEPDAIPHDAPDLEALLPREVAGTVLEISSARATSWQSGLLRQAIENVGADPAEAFVAIGLGGTGEETIAVTLYAIPGVPQDRLEAEFSRDAYLDPGRTWEQREVHRKLVWWSSADEFDTAFYALGGLVVTAGGSSERVRSALDALP